MKPFIVWMLVVVMQLTSILPMATVYAGNEGGEQVENVEGIETTSPGGIGIEGKGVAPIGTEFQFITGVMITDKDGENLFGQENIGKSSEVHINYTFAIPNAYDIGETREPYTLTLPKEIEIQNPISIPLEDGDEKLMATVQVAVSGEIRIEFTPHASTLSNVTGSFKIETKFDEKEIQNDEVTVIEFDLGASNKQDITVKFIKENETTDVKLVKKSLGYDEALNEITWEITVRPETTPNRRPITDVVITDTIQEGQTYVDRSATISKKDHGNYADGSFDYTAPNLTYTFANDINQDKDEEYIITLKTKPELSAFEGMEQGDIITFSNQAQASYDTDGESVPANLRRR